MTKLNVILSFAAVALAITFDGANAASLRSDDRLLSSFDTSDSTDGERFLSDVEGSESSESLDGERFLMEMEGSDVDEGSESTDGVRFLEVEGSTDDEGSDSLAGDRFLQE
eukprot:jgi/Phyca11/22122/fgenesh1_pg.PHYCAscaffold_863_\